MKKLSYLIIIILLIILYEVLTLPVTYEICDNNGECNLYTNEIYQYIIER